MSDPQPGEGQKEAVKTYIEQTKLLVALSSAFLIAPAALLGVFKDRTDIGLKHAHIVQFLATEALFVLSVLAGYVVLASIAGYQHIGRFDVHRPATAIASIFQITSYIAGMMVFVFLAWSLAAARTGP